MSTQTPNQATSATTRNPATSTTTSPTPEWRPAAVRHTFTETKNGFKTSEFYVMVLFVAGVLLSGYVDADSLARDQGWFIAGIVAAAYVVSRGLAKLATREPREEPIDR